MNDGTKIILILVLVAIFSILIYAGIEALIIKNNNNSIIGGNILINRRIKIPRDAELNKETIDYILDEHREEKARKIL